MSEKAPKAEKADKKADHAAGDKTAAKAESSGKGGGLLSKTPLLLGCAMVIEAVVLFAGFKFLGGGAKASNGAQFSQTDPHDAKSGDSKEGEQKDGSGTVEKGKTVEIPVVDFKAINKLSGRSFLYDVSIVATAKAEYEDKIKQTFADRGALIKDRIRTIIAQSDPEKLGGGSEPGLETLRWQVKYQLDEIVGEGMIDEVLVPRCIPYPAGF